MLKFELTPLSMANVHTFERDLAGFLGDIGEPISHSAMPANLTAGQIMATHMLSEQTEGFVLTVTLHGSVIGLALIKVLDDPLDGQRFGFVPFCFVKSCEEAIGCSYKLLYELERLAECIHLPSIRIGIFCGSPMLSAALHRAQHGGSVEVEWVEVYKSLGDEPSQPKELEGISVRLAQESDYPFITELWRRAVCTGLPLAKRESANNAEICGFADQTLGAVLAADGVVLIAEMDVPIAHAVISLRYPETLTGRPIAVLHDTFVVEEHMRKGISRFLTAHSELLAYIAKSTFISGTVRGLTHHCTQRILESISSTGWTPYRWILRWSART